MTSVALITAVTGLPTARPRSLTASTVTDAIASHPQVFPDFYITILRSAELTGHVDAVLDQLASYIERDENAKRKIKAALTYPAIVMLLAMVSVTIIVTMALPKFRSFFASSSW